jgi:hypothetical protein
MKSEKAGLQANELSPAAFKASNLLQISDTPAAGFRPRYGSLGRVLGFGDPSKLPKAPLDSYF